MTNQWILTSPDTDDYNEADAPTAELAVRAVRRKYARYDLTDVRERTVRAVLEVSHCWQSYLLGVVHRDGDWLVLDGATALAR